MPKRKSCHRVFSRAFKVGIVRRMLAGENVSALARELKATRKDLYVWRDRFLAGGPEALRGRGRPPKAEAASLVASGAKAQAAVPDTPAAELEEARKRIAELERKVGQQQVDLDFFRQALQRVRGARRPSAEPGAGPGTTAIGRPRRRARKRRGCATPSSALRWPTLTMAIAGSQRCCVAKAWR